MTSPIFVTSASRMISERDVFLSFAHRSSASYIDLGSLTAQVISFDSRPSTLEACPAAFFFGVFLFFITHVVCVFIVRVYNNVYTTSSVCKIFFDFFYYFYVSTFIFNRIV